MIYSKSALFTLAVALFGNVFAADTFGTPVDSSVSSPNGACKLNWQSHWISSTHGTSVNHASYNSWNNPGSCTVNSAKIRRNDGVIQPYTFAPGVAPGGAGQTVFDRVAEEYTFTLVAITCDSCNGQSVTVDTTATPTTAPTGNTCNTGVTLERRAETFQSDGQTYYIYDISVTNNAATTLNEVVIFINAAFTQSWNVNVRPDTFYSVSLFGGLQAGQSYSKSAGFITANPSATIAVRSTQC
eukprot:TRINITY_DN3374_c0_g1_i1.p1 TRINITY_DN3374_c0_g1~~TRINITY_DN3374_c0_g1_i1.p1  ORF type:complete len:253 (+),score=102.77 TRINITY_DN3374_c0_g1_i1:36-761(+)